MTTKSPSRNGQTKIRTYGLPVRVNDGVPRSDYHVTRGRIVESVATVASRNPRHLRARSQREDVDASRCIGDDGRRVIHGLSLLLQ
jgi:hypothetical protein